MAYPNASESESQESPFFADIFEHFTNFSQQGFNSESFPVRCFVRFRFGKEGAWQSFWERERNPDQIELERNYEWKDDMTLSQPLHGEQYAIRRIEKKLILFNEEIMNNHLNWSYRPFQVDEYFYRCCTRTINCHYAGLEIKTKHEQPGKYFALKCFYPGNILVDEDKSFTCYNPRRVTISEKELVPTPDIINCVGSVDGVSFWDANDDGTYTSENRLPDYRREKVEVEMYLNTSPCKKCFRSLLDFTYENKNAFIHVKYASLSRNSHLESFDRTNAINSRCLKITPFTDNDWRSLSREIIRLLRTAEIENLDKRFDQLNLESKEKVNKLCQRKNTLAKIKHDIENSNDDDLKVTRKDMEVLIDDLEATKKSNELLDHLVKGFLVKARKNWMDNSNSSSSSSERNSETESSD